MRLVAKFPGACHDCGRPFAAGITIRWVWLPSRIERVTKCAGRCDQARAHAYQLEVAAGYVRLIARGDTPVTPEQVALSAELFLPDVRAAYEWPRQPKQHDRAADRIRSFDAEQRQRALLGQPLQPIPDWYPQIAAAADL